MTQTNSILKFAPLLSKRLAFVPVTNDEDELIQAINDDSEDAKWQLHEHVDPVEIARFWEKARDELGRENQLANTD